MDLATLIRNATDDELVVIKSILQRAATKPAIVVTLDIDNRRYVVDQADEHLFEDTPDGPTPEDRYDRPRFDFGARWLRQYGKVDEMHRSLGGYEVKKVQRIDRAKVWGRR
jgi:hypothetical protein